MYVKSYKFNQIKKVVSPYFLWIIISQCLKGTDCSLYYTIRYFIYYAKGFERPKIIWIFMDDISNT